MTSVALNCLVCGEDPYDDIFSVQINTIDIKLGKTRDENVIAMLKLEDLSIAQGMNILEIVEPPKKRAKIEGDTDAEVAEDVKSLRNFWQALKTTKYDKEMPFFTVSEDIKFFGKRSRPSKLFVRKCYNDLLGIIIDNIKNGKRDYRLTGNPGIGKTFFGYYLIYDLVKKGKTVIYDVHTMERFVILLGQTVEEVKYLDRSHDSVEIRIYLSKPEVCQIIIIPLIESSSSSQPPHSSLIESSSSGQPPTGLLLDHPSQSFTEIFNQHLSLDQPPEQFFDQPSTDPSLDQPIKEEYYTDTIVKFASDYVGQQVILELEKSIIDKCHIDVDAVMKGGKSDPVLYDIYKKQRYSTTDDKDALNTGPWIKQCLKQYVLGIDLNFGLPVEMPSASSITEQKCYCKGSCNTNQCGCQRNKLPCGEGPKNKNKYFPAILTLVDVIFSLVITVVINYTNTINKIFYPTNAIEQIIWKECLNLINVHYKCKSYEETTMCSS
ncbi:unnamed protein product [Rhizophagus irregularis]|nr:unnamed protein product [Rhizophagus irregularis]